MPNNPGKLNSGILVFGFIEILIGVITLAGVIISLIYGKSTKSPSVLIFVLTTATISLALGVGIIIRDLKAYHLLLYFSSMIIFSKILIFAKIITLSGALETIIPSPLKNTVSILYHSLVIFYFTRAHVKKLFGERRITVFGLKNNLSNRKG